MVSVLFSAISPVGVLETMVYSISISYLPSRIREFRLVP